MQRTKAWNSTLHNISKKRQAIYQQGEIVGNFTVVKCINPHSGYGTHRMYEIICNHCGKTTIVRSTLLKQNESCGCLRTALHTQRLTKHGHYHERLYRIWFNMISRCEHKTNSDYNNYGGRGICVCKDWHNYETFYKWAINNKYKQSLSIDRKDVNGNYCPENCRWISLKEQAQNKRNTIRTEKGKSLREMVAKNDIKSLREYGLTLWAKAVKKRAGYKCELCGRSGMNFVLDAHHWYATKASYAPTDLWLSNGCCLCRFCHTLAHNKVEEYKNKIAHQKRACIATLERARHQTPTASNLMESIIRIKKELEQEK